MFCINFFILKTIFNKVLSEETIEVIKNIIAFEFRKTLTDVSAGNVHHYIEESDVL